jgi:hypothetical protein
MRIKLISSLLVLLIAGPTCKNSQADTSPSETKNSRAQQYTNFPGTAVYIQLPNGFAWNETAMGFVNDENGAAINYDAFRKLRHNSGMPVVEIAPASKEQTVTISGNAGTIKTFADGSTGARLLLSFGRPDSMEFIEATFFTKNKETAGEIMAALQSVMVKKSN